MGQQRPVARKGAPAAADLVSVPNKTHHRAPSRKSTSWGIIIPKKFSHCCECLGSRIPRGDLAMGLRTPRDFDFEGLCDLIT